MGKDMSKSPDVESWVKEFVNLNLIYEEKLKRVSSLASSSRMDLSFRDVARVVGDCNQSTATEKYIGMEAVDTSRNFSCIIIALKKVGSITLAGVEYNNPVEGGHALSFRDDGILGRDGYCLWTSFEKLRLINPEK